MRYLYLIYLLVFCKLAIAIDIFGTDYYLRDSFVRLVDDERGTSIILDTDQFFEEPGTTELNPEEYDNLTKVAKVVKQHPNYYLSITGHTDNVYSQDKRYQLSQDYARRIADFLVDAGVDPNRIREVSGEGDLWPIAANDTQERRHLNRRVEITFLREAPKRVEYEEREVEEERKETYLVNPMRSEKRAWHIEVEEEYKGKVSSLEVEIDENVSAADSVSVIVNENKK